MTRMMPKFVVGVAIASLMFVTSGCVSKSDYDTKVGELKTQAEKAQKDAEAKIKSLEGEVAAAKEVADKVKGAEGRAEIEGLEKDLAAAKEATEKAVKDATDKADKDIAAAKEEAEKAQKEAADKIKGLEGEVAAAKEAAAKAEKAQKDAEAKIKALEEKPAPKKPADTKPAPK